jgi:chromosome segregation ATPase
VSQGSAHSSDVAAETAKLKSNLERTEARLAGVMRERDQLALELERLLRRRQGGHDDDGQASRQGTSSEVTGVPSGTSSLRQYPVGAEGSRHTGGDRRQDRERASALEGELQHLRSVHSDVQVRFQETVAALQHERRHVVQLQEEVQRCSLLLEQARRETEERERNAKMEQSRVDSQEQHLRTLLQEHQRQSNRWQANSQNLRSALQTVDTDRDKLQDELERAVSLRGVGAYFL